ncbi:MAG: site-specific DNA-methyltransferase [Anaerolineales bacterium]|nr:MAG: site-specific DNA-methyltransferase [Anaerolineales bacterium]
MPTLDWIGKKAVLNHHNEVPFHLLRCDPELSVGEASGNLLVQGDNLLALKALLPYYSGQVKCIYIDPPYNTGNEGWVYNDNVNSPEMRDWLGRAVGSEAEDLSRHDKWLCMMYPRLLLLREMLSDDGSLWMSLDDNEMHNARGILDEIFGANNFITTVIWEKNYSPKSTAKHLSANHDFILVYAKNSSKWQRNLLPRSEEQDNRYRNPDNDTRGMWKPGGLDARNYYSEGTYPITTPSGRVISGPPRGSYWRVSFQKLMALDADNRIWWGENGDNVPSIKRFLSEVRQGVVPETIWTYEEVGHTQEAKQQIVRILPDAANVFNTPKPTRLIERVIQIASNPGDLILDSFAGSGTTGQASIRLNRKFILVEIDTVIASTITRKRLQQVIQGYAWLDQRGNSHQEEGLGGDFRYCELGPTLFDAYGQIRLEVVFSDLARHVFFTETGQPLPGGEDENALLGVCNGTAIYLLYNGVMHDSDNVLTPQTLAELPAFDGPKVVYADGCKIGLERLRELNVTFKQIPYQIKVR